jgi:predicted transcriptional regulator
MNDLGHHFGSTGRGHPRQALRWCAADLTQVELATQMGVAQSEISRIEKGHDMPLSTLTAYLTAAGEHPRVVVTVNGKDVELD